MLRPGHIPRVAGTRTEAGRNALRPKHACAATHEGVHYDLARVGTVRLSARHDGREMWTCPSGTTVRPAVKDRGPTFRRLHDAALAPVRSFAAQGRTPRRKKPPIPGRDFPHRQSKGWASIHQTDRRGQHCFRCGHPFRRRRAAAQTPKLPNASGGLGERLEHRFEDTLIRKVDISRMPVAYPGLSGELRVDVRGGDSTVNGPIAAPANGSKTGTPFVPAVVTISLMTSYSAFRAPGQAIDSPPCILKSAGPPRHATKGHVSRHGAHRLSRVRCGTRGVIDIRMGDYQVAHDRYGAANKIDVRCAISVSPEATSRRRQR